MTVVTLISYTIADTSLTFPSNTPSCLIRNHLLRSATDCNDTTPGPRT